MTDPQRINKVSILDRFCAPFRPALAGCKHDGRNTGHPFTTSFRPALHGCRHDGTIMPKTTVLVASFSLNKTALVPGFFLKKTAQRIDKGSIRDQ